MRRLLLLVGILAVMASPAPAGRNANGALVVHVDDTIVFRAIYDYCATAVPATCEELVPTSYHTPEEVTMVWFLAAFRPEASPGVTTIQFGIEHNLPAGQGYFVQYSACGPSPLELPDTGWPETGFGNLVAYSGPVYDHLFKFYWFALYNEDNESYFGTRTYPNTNEAKFVDDGNPPVEDLIFNFGTVRWEVPGGNMCPPGGDYCTCCLPDGVCLGHQPTDDCYAQGGECLDPNVVCDPNPCAQLEACCFVDEHCELLLPLDCINAGGNPDGPGTDCDPNPCHVSSAEACCFSDAHCEWIEVDDCIALGGSPQGVGTTCETVVCETVPAEHTTWGSIKARFR
jgi:hypothetical protein